VSEAYVVIEGETLRLSGRLTFENASAIAGKGEHWIRQSAPSICRANLCAIEKSNSASLIILLSWLRAAASARKQLVFEDIPPHLAGC
jgi:ABC-type transporter Mla MlaB component